MSANNLRLPSCACVTRRGCTCNFLAEWHICDERRNCKYFDRNQLAFVTKAREGDDCCCYICRVVRQRIESDSRAHAAGCPLYSEAVESATAQLYVLRMLPSNIQEIRREKNILPYSLREQYYARWYVGIAGENNSGVMNVDAALHRFCDHNGRPRPNRGRFVNTGPAWSHFFLERGWEIELHYVGPYVGTNRHTFEDNLTNELMLGYGKNKARGGTKRFVVLSEDQERDFRERKADAEGLCSFCLNE